MGFAPCGVTVGGKEKAKHKYRLVNQLDLISVLPDGGRNCRQNRQDPADSRVRKTGEGATGYIVLMQAHLTVTGSVLMAVYTV
jgi:hypothetical protein